MITHRPAGSGHPYLVTTDQRWPVHPVAGEPLRLGVRASADVSEVVAEITVTAPDGGVTTRSQPLTRVEPARAEGAAEPDGHLAAAQERLAGSGGGWVLETTAPDAGSTLAYLFIGTTDDGREQRTRGFSTGVAAWQPAPDDVVTAVGARRVIPGSVSVLTDGRVRSRVRFALPLADGEHVTGFGERFDTLDQRGSVLDCVVFEQYKSQGAARKTYLPMPFAHVIGGDGWGFHVRTTRRTWFDIGSSTPDRIIVEAEVGPAAPGVEVAFYDGAPREVLDAFVAETGRPEELPDWVFRLWASGNEWNTQAEVVRQMDLHREHDVPVGSVVIEAWSDESTFTAFRDARYEVTEDGAPHRLADFTFPADGAWPDPKGMVDDLRERDIRVLLWQIPLLKARPHPTGQAKADREAAVRENVLIREPDARGGLRPYRNRGWWFPLSTMPDLTDERAARWWTDKRRYLVEEVGIDGFKTDGGEHAWGSELVYLDGRRGDEANNTFAVAYAKAYGDLLRSAGKAPVTFSRAGFTGAGAHGAVWAGDENSTWEAFRWSMFAGLSAAASGVLYWGWDIAGFSGPLPTAELYLRATAASTFVPIMQYHSEYNHHRTPLRDRTPWNIAAETGDESVLPVFRSFAQLRERLVPYLAASARETVRTSVPLMRPVYFDHPSFEGAWSHPFQWFLGADLFVSPVVTEGDVEHEVALPPGEWIDAFRGERVSGGAVLRRTVEIDEAPVYVRAEAWEAMAPVFGR
ncbi:galactose mutarotase-like protein [Microbacterium sp. SLBN-154]|uniref:glycoside hydrolase family 31 protein n=1 Tax=Microbacterium sp. SLBN-154 TaxID=2768458 RepID=UPI00115165F1|nr:TIM-barrel domain-containing protein [Microbacterium sp. SLBN-154]TQK18650.1 galactose mutarotase-like protein [Microbacterium sp. SLBN-154]